MKTVNYGVVGTGYFGYELAKILQDMDGARVVAVYDPENAKEVALKLNCSVEKNLESLCKRKDIDAIIVASPNAYHKEPVLLAAKYHKHVFCEKPIALSYKDCSEMIEATSRKGLIFMAGHVMNFMDGVRTAKQLINDGVLGEILFCHAERTGWEDPKEEVSWKKMNKYSGGHLYHHIHELDFIQFIMGPAERATMIGGNVASQGEGYGDEDDMLFISLEFAGRKFATIQYGSSFRWGKHYVKIQGTKAALLIDLQEAKVILRRDNEDHHFFLHASEEEDEERRRIYKGLDGGIMYGNPGTKVPLWLHTIMKRELNLFQEVLKGAEIDEEFRPLLDGTAARNSIATADALTLSLKEDRKVSISEVMNN